MEDNQEKITVTTSLYQTFPDKPTIKEVVTGLQMAAHHAGNWQNPFTPKDCVPYIEMLEKIIKSERTRAVRENDESWELRMAEKVAREVRKARLADIGRMRKAQLTQGPGRLSGSDPMAPINAELDRIESECRLRLGRIRPHN